MDKLEKDDPFCELEAHGLAVGLPEGLMGNSEGLYHHHLTLGADKGPSRTLEHWSRASRLARPRPH